MYLTIISMIPGNPRSGYCVRKGQVNSLQHLDNCLKHNNRLQVHKTFDEAYGEASSKVLCIYMNMKFAQTVR